jgi:hypothetical protein
MVVFSTTEVRCQASCQCSIWRVIEMPARILMARVARHDDP